MAHCRNAREPLSKPNILWLCSGISILYVASLYVFVPNAVQRLHRDDPRQIRWRSLATVIVSAISLLCSRLVTCEDPITSLFECSFPILVQEARSTVISLCHLMFLYMNPLVFSVVRVSRLTPPSNGVYVRLKTLMRNYYALCVGPGIAALFRTDGNALQWILLRNYIIAPLAEEIVFRHSIIPIIQAGGMSNRMIVWVSPLFFGFAHFHHAFLKYCQGLPGIAVLLQTMFQFTYTTLFGIYASYVYLRTKSVLAIFVCHAFCNINGLPDLSFLSQTSPYHSDKLLLASTLCIGILGFYLGIVFDIIPEVHRP